MENKELKEKLKNVPKDKYIYQRYKGRISKYIVNDKYYIDVATGMATPKHEFILMGKVKEEIIDLIEVGDYVNGSKLLSIDYAEDKEGNCDKLHFYYSFEDDGKDINEYYEKLIIKSIVTKEQFKSIEYKVEEDKNE